MKILKCIISNFRAIEGTVTFYFYDYNVIVGKNDVGKSNLLKALDLFLNENETVPDIQNFNSGESKVEIELSFSMQKQPEQPETTIIIDENIPTTFKKEELLDKEGALSIKKVWDTSASKIKPKWYIKRKIYNNNDFLNMNERDLIKLCRSLSIATNKGNGEEFNNCEKRQKLREYNQSNDIPFGYEYEELSTIGNSRSKFIYDAIKKILPRFEYFKADSSLADSDKSIQNHFKELSENKLEECGVAQIQDKVKIEIESVLLKITDKINQVVLNEEKVKPEIKFDWSNFLKIGFVTQNGDNIIPLNFRGDGFRRITMMSYFEYLAEENKEEHQNIIFGFEEPETFLHPSAQEQLFDKLINMVENDYQILVTTHSPIIVANSNRENIIHISRENNKFTLNQKRIDISLIVKDLGISVKNQFIQEFENCKMLILVEGIDDVNAFKYIAQIYKDNSSIDNSFDDLGIILIFIGGCEQIKHWVALDLLKKLDKPFFIIQDSDKKNANDTSENKSSLEALGLRENNNFHILYKRNIENYLNFKTIKRLIPVIDIQESEWDCWADIKKLCKGSQFSGKLGGKNVAAKHFNNQTFEELQESFNVNGKDEFLFIYEQIIKIYDK